MSTTIQACALSSDVGLDLLVHEPRRLKQQAAVLDDAVGRLSLSNYRVFIANHDCVRALRSQSDRFARDTSSLLAELRTFAEDTQAFRTEALDAITAHRRNSRTLRHHLQILDLLELPQLIDACVRNGLYDGALDIAAFANVLERRHLYRSARAAVNAAHGGASLSSPPMPFLSSARSVATQADTLMSSHGTGVVMSVVEEIRESMVVLRGKLLKQLLAPITLPACLSAVSNLRRLDTLVLERLPMAMAISPSATPLAADAAGAHTTTTATAAGQADTGAVVGDSARMSQHLQLSLELKLQLDFLEARGAWLQSELEVAERTLRSKAGVAGSMLPSSFLLPPVSSSSSSSSSSSTSSLDDVGLGGDGAAEISQWLIEVIDKNRALWFEICTQYRAIFSAESGNTISQSRSLPPFPSSSSSSSSTQQQQALLQQVGTAELVLSQWLTRRIERFVTFLRHHLFAVRDVSFALKR